ncbi:MAG: DUF1538 domain-containing protein [Clostridia bacterium]|nr:DUF1538 domain-containing protein [Clostridia bacterium]
MILKHKLTEKFGEALSAVAPIVALVLLLSLSIAPIPSGVLLSFLLGGVMLVVGMMFFSVGAEVAMQPMGELVGARVTKTRNLPLILALGFLMGVMITISEPDLQVLAQQVQAIPNLALILAVAVGVGAFLMLALVRIFYRIPLRLLLMGFYLLILGLTFLAPESFRAVAYDSGGVTTGPMTVPFIMSFGMGIAAIRSDSSAAEDSFGLVALCSIGPILAVLILSMVYRADGADYAPVQVTNVADSIELRTLFGGGLPEYLREMLVSILPIAAFFFIFNFILLRLRFANLSRIGLGLLYTYIGLTVFMTGANYGFMPAGVYLGQTLGELPYRWIIIPVGMLIGYLVVKAEPAVYVLMRQVEELTDGAITGKSLQLSMCAGVGAAVGLSMLRVLLGISVLWIIIPGYVLALGMSLACPKLFTAIAFDSGGVASGPMTAAFLLPMTMGFCTAVGGNLATDAFGVVALVAMTPLLTIQGLGLLYRFRTRSRRQAQAGYDLFAELPDDAVIEL